MKNIIIGTAGHIDHGKTTLIKALTGQNTDRWKEEQRRGITIDLGFAYFDTKNGNRIGIIDVPGHEKFVNNMVAGVVGMDIVLLVIAADEGVMPQTREHMNILELLGLKKSIIVLNKCDLVEEDWLELVEAETREEMKGTFLEEVPIVCVSAVTGQGLDLLVETMERLMRDEVEAKSTQAIPRLPIDRAFSLPGFGTIVTGTLISGTIKKDDILEVYPIGRECKVRSIQVHGKDQIQCEAGQRVAINLSNIKKAETYRGCVLAPKNNMKNTDLLDVKLKVLPDSARVVRNSERLHLCIGTSEVLCRAKLLDKKEIGPGEEGFAQLRLEEPVAVKRGDCFVIRFYSPLETIGGGAILEPNPARRKRANKNSIEELELKQSGSLSDVMELQIKASAESMVTLAELARTMAHSIEELEKCLGLLKGEGIVYEYPMKKDRYLWHRESEFLKRQEILTGLGNFQEKFPYQFGMKKAELQMTYLRQLKPNAFNAYIDQLEGLGLIQKKEEYVCLAGFKVVKDEKYLKIESILMNSLVQAGFDFVRFSEIDLQSCNRKEAEDILIILQAEEKVVRINEEIYTLRKFMDVAKTEIQNHLLDHEVITIAQVRDMFSTSRKSAKPILEYTDSIRVTKKTATESEWIAR